MVITNALLSIGFALVTNFAAIVGVPDESVPTTIEDLRELTVGDPHSPVDLYMTHNRGTMYGIRDGAVTMFETPVSYRHMQNPDLLPRLLGKPILSSDDVLRLASGVIDRLVKGTNPVANIRPIVEPAGKTFQGEEIPVYGVVWKKPYASLGFSYFAAVEVDARTGKITSLELHDPGFSDYGTLQRMVKEAYVEDASRPDRSRKELVPTPLSRLFPSPTTNEVAQAIVSWLWLTKRLGIEIGGEMSIEAVNWDQTCVFTNNPILADTDRPCRVEFTSGAWTLALRGVSLSHTAADCYFTRNWQAPSREQRSTFKGRINYRWQDMAKSLERTLVEKLEIPQRCLDPYVPHPECGVDELGKEVPNKRFLVLWSYPHNWQRQGFGAEFDLETGEIKDIGFTDAEIVRAVARAQGKTL